MVQVNDRVGTAQKGSMKAVAGSGMASMSEASMDFQPRMDEPSKPKPSVKTSSLSSAVGTLKCCQVPKVSTNLMSTILAPCCLARSMADLGVLGLLPLLMGIWVVFCSVCLLSVHKKSPSRRASRGENPSDGVFALFLGPNANRILNGADEHFPVANLAGPGCLHDGFQRSVHCIVGQDDLDLDLGKKIDRVLAAPVNLCVPFLPPKTLHLADRHSFDPQRRQCLFYVLKLERLDDGFDFLHAERGGC